MDLRRCNLSATHLTWYQKYRHEYFWSTDTFRRFRTCSRGTADQRFS